MRAFHFKTEYNKLLTPEVVAYLTQIHEYKKGQTDDGRTANFRGKAFCL